MGPTAEKSAFRGSTNHINVLLCREQSNAQNVPDTAFLPWLTQAHTINNVKNEISHSENPMPIVEAAYQHLDREAAAKLTSQLNLLKTQWQKDEISKDAVVETTNTIKSNHINKHCEVLDVMDAHPELYKILIQLQNMPETPQTKDAIDKALSKILAEIDSYPKLKAIIAERKNNTRNPNLTNSEILFDIIKQLKNERSRLDNSVKSLANAAHDLEQARKILSLSTDNLYKTILSSGSIPTTVLDKLPASTTSRQFR